MKNKELFEFENSFVQLPQLPGLGIELDENKIREASQQGLSWKNPRWRNYDETVAEW